MFNIIIEMSFPANLKYVVSRLSGMNTNVFRLSTQNVTSASNNQIVTFNLPTNSILNLKSLALHANFAVSNSLAGAGDPKVGFPANKASVIDRIEILAGGTAIVQSFLGYNTAQTIKRRLFDKRGKQDSDLRVLSGSYPVEIANPAADEPAGDYIIDEWLTFLNETAPQFIDTGILPEVTVRIFLAGPEILRMSAAKAAGQTVGFSLNDMYITMESVSLGSGIYDLSLQEQMNSAGYLSIGYKNYYSFTNSFPSTTGGVSGSARFSVASQSIDCIYSVIRNTTTTASYNTGDQEQVTMVDALGPAVVSKYFNMTSQGLGNWQYLINNTMVPQYRAGTLDALHLVGVNKDDTCSNNRGSLVTSASQWANNYWCAMIRLCHAGDLEDPRVSSGFDSRGTNSLCNFELRPSGANGINGTVEVYTLVECNSVIRVGMGRSIEIVN